MATTEQYFSLVRTSKSSWIAVPVNRSGPAVDATIYSRDPEAAILRNGSPAQDLLFAQSSTEREAFSERYPRLTIAMIAFILFGITVTAEVELLMHAGYVWH